MPTPPLDDHGIEQLLSKPTPGAIEAVKQLDGDYMVLGVGGKMGTSTAVMLRRALTGVPPIEAMELLLNKLKKTPNNIMFLLGMNAS